MTSTAASSWCRQLCRSKSLRHRRPARNAANRRANARRHRSVRNVANRPASAEPRLWFARNAAKRPAFVQRSARVSGSPFPLRAMMSLSHFPPSRTSRTNQIAGRSRLPSRANAPPGTTRAGCAMQFRSRWTKRTSTAWRSGNGPRQVIPPASRRPCCEPCEASESLRRGSPDPGSWQASGRRRCVPPAPQVP